MARKGWDSLSPTYRKRLEKGGVSRADYEAGRSIKKARGHAQTPERPSQASPTKHPTYFAKRQKLIRDFQAKKRRLWEGSRKYHGQRSMDNVRDGNPTNAQLEWALQADEDELIDAIREDSETFRFVGYH